MEQADGDGTFLSGWELIEVVDGGNKVESEPKTLPLVAIGFLENPEDFEPANDMFNHDS